MTTVAVIGLGLDGLLLLTVAADQLVLGAGRLAAMLRIAPVVVGCSDHRTGHKHPGVPGIRGARAR